MTTHQPTRDRHARLRSRPHRPRPRRPGVAVPTPAVDLRQIQRLHLPGGSPVTRARRTRALLQRLTELGVVVRLERTVGGVQPGSSAQVFGLSGRGLAVLNVQARTADDGARCGRPSPTLCSTCFP